MPTPTTMSHHHINRRILPNSSAARSIADANLAAVASAVGNPSLADCYFLLTLIGEAKPRDLLEIGVASGTTALMMLRMLDHLSLDSRLVSVDLADSYYADPTKPVGYLVSDHYSSLPGRWTLLTSTQAATLSAHPTMFLLSDQRRSFEFIFIDAHHGHPWPTLDMLCLLPYAIPGSWVALHDINLPLIAEPWFGAVYPLQDWPLDVVISAETPLPNIGALRLSDAGPYDSDRLIKSLAKPWDCGIHPYHREKILGHLRTFLAAGQLEVVRTRFEANAEVEVK